MARFVPAVKAILSDASSIGAAVIHEQGALLAEPRCRRIAALCVGAIVVSCVAPGCPLIALFGRLRTCAPNRDNLAEMPTVKTCPGDLPGAITMNKAQKEPEDEDAGSAWKNIGKLLFLIAALVAAWFVLERLMGSK